MMNHKGATNIPKQEFIKPGLLFNEKYDAQQTPNEYNTEYLYAGSRSRNLVS